MANRGEAGSSRRSNAARRGAAQEGGGTGRGLGRAGRGMAGCAGQRGPVAAGRAGAPPACAAPLTQVSGGRLPPRWAVSQPRPRRSALRGHRAPYAALTVTSPGHCLFPAPMVVPAASGIVLEGLPRPGWTQPLVPSAAPAVSPPLCPSPAALRAVRGWHCWFLPHPNSEHPPAGTPHLPPCKHPPAPHAWQRGVGCFPLRGKQDRSCH